ncbi:MAG TPA: hypothetical protein VIW48_09000 [Nitrospiraceae bacterium]
MFLPAESKFAQLRALFEGRKAIYVEKGALLVMVSSICVDVTQQCVSAEVEEIPTVGFPVGALDESKLHWQGPFRWSIGGGYLTCFSDYTWQMGYGGCSLFFAPRIVNGIQSLALRWTDNLDPFQRYKEVLDYLKDHDAYEPTQQLFEEQ